jgi:hypothetical protein
MTSRLRFAIYVYWYTLQYAAAAEQVPTQARGSNIVCLDIYRRKKYASIED